MTGVVLSTMTLTEAEWVTNRIRNAVNSVRVGFEELEAAVVAAKDGNAHVALGYASWTAYLADVLGREPLRLDAVERRELVAYLSGQGMSARAIAPIVNVDHATVARDVQVSHRATPAITVNTETGEITDTAVAVGGGEAPAATVTGLDGKTYTRPATTPRRSPLPDQFRSAGWDLDRAIQRLTKLADDDRFAANKKEVAAHLHSHLSHAIEVCQDLLDRIDHNHQGV